MSDKNQGSVTIFVQKSNSDGKVGIWETDERHPGGVALVHGTDVIEVFETQLVSQKLKTKELKRVDGPENKAGPAALTNENRSILEVRVEGGTVTGVETKPAASTQTTDTKTEEAFNSATTSATASSVAPLPPSEAAKAQTRSEISLDAPRKTKLS